MANRFYAPGNQRAAKVGNLFAAIASRYDRINDLQSFGLHRRWKLRLVKLAKVRPGERALDVCCGTGDIALALAHGGAEVMGLDFTQPMLSVAEERARVQSLKTEGGGPKFSVVFFLGDAQQLPFTDACFDIVTVGYGLRNLESWETGLREMHRVARPGGRMLALDFGRPDNAIWRGIYFAYLRFVVPLLGRTFCGSASAYAYILESLKHYPAQHAVAVKMREMGLTRVRVVNLLGGAMSINYGEKA